MFLFDILGELWDEFWDSPIVYTVVFSALGMIGYMFYQTTTPEHQAAQAIKAKAEAEELRRRAIPVHVSTSADGCEVWRFHDAGRFHWYTKCPNARVTTNSTYTTKSGKTTKTHHESITTESK